MSGQQPPGWYPDGRGAMRWWDGYRWTEHVQQAAVATAPVQPGGYGAAAYPNGEYPKVPDATPIYTRWIWWIVIIPVLQTFVAAGYMIDMTLRFTGFMSRMFEFVQDDVPDPSSMSGLMSEQMAIIFSPWYFALLFGGLIVYGVCVWFSYLDHRDLEALGYVRPFHWAWSFLGTLVYIIGRSVVVHRRSGRGYAPMWVTIIWQCGVIVLSIVWSVWFTNTLMSTLLAGIPTTI